MASSFLCALCLVFPSIFEPKVLIIGDGSLTDSKTMSMISAILKDATGKAPLVCGSRLRDADSLETYLKCDAATKNLNAFKWDRVVLQESHDKLHDPRPTHKFSPQIRDKFAKRGITTIVFQNIAEKDDELPQIHYSISCNVFASLSGARIAPVGDVWASLLKKRANDSLYSEDKKYLTPFGRYVMSSVIASTILGRVPEGIKHAKLGISDDESSRALGACKEILNTPRLKKYNDSIK